MTDKEALQELIYVTPISESDKARMLAFVPEMTDEEVQDSGSILAVQEMMLDQKIAHAIEKIDTFLDQQKAREKER
ncbi:hypothetical protein EBT31_01510 [bacterium]|nr:hypothetical protein [bacterium]NBX50806.1 hypothetical protein [bacterium]